VRKTSGSFPLREGGERIRNDYTTQRTMMQEKKAACPSRFVLGDRRDGKRHPSHCGKEENSTNIVNHNWSGRFKKKSRLSWQYRKLADTASVYRLCAGLFSQHARLTSRELFGTISLICFFMFGVVVSALVTAAPFFQPAPFNPCRA